ncbi:MAG: amidase domain-containing protein [Firmicutes bacterium]|nr:amidase domain-containing protein [Bacillota bacterium]
MKKVFIYVLAVLIVLSNNLPCYAYSDDNSAQKSYWDYLLDEDEISFLTMRDGQKALSDYFQKYNMDMLIGTKEYYDYIVDQTLTHDDKNLLSNDNYRVINAYMLQYKLYSDNCFENNTQEKFYDNESFLDTTINEIRHRNYILLNSMYKENANKSMASYSASNAVAYAVQWGGNEADPSNGILANHKHNPAYPQYSGDCTNFVSQCLYAGGIPFVGNPSSLGIGVHTSTTNWYCSKITEWHGNTPVQGFSLTTSWNRVQDFYTYMHSVANSIIHYSSRNTFISMCAPGDVAQLVDSDTGTVHHSIIITSKSGYNVTYCSHSHYRTNEPLTTVTDTLFLFDFT